MRPAARHRIETLASDLGLKYKPPTRVIPLDEAKARLLARFKKETKVYCIEITIWPKNDPRSQVRSSCTACGTTEYSALDELSAFNDQHLLNFIQAHKKCFDDEA